MFCLFRVILPSQLNSALLYVDSMLIEGKRRFPKTLHTLVKQEIHSKTNVVQRLGASPLKCRCFFFILIIRYCQSRLSLFWCRRWLSQMTTCYSLSFDSNRNTYVYKMLPDIFDYRSRRKCNIILELVPDHRSPNTGRC